MTQSSSVVEILKSLREETVTNSAFGSLPLTEHVEVRFFHSGSEIFKAVTNEEYHNL
jgi:hypothetical protein